MRSPLSAVPQRVISNFSLFFFHNSQHARLLPAPATLLSPVAVPSLDSSRRRGKLRRREVKRGRRASPPRTTTQESASTTRSTTRAGNATKSEKKRRFSKSIHSSCFSSFNGMLCMVYFFSLEFHIWRSRKLSTPLNKCPPGMTRTLDT